MKIKRLLCVLLVPLFFVSVGISADAADKKTADDNVIKVGFFSFSGYHVQDKEGRRSGYGYDFLQKIGNYMDYTYEYIGYDMSYSDSLEMLERGEIDVLTSVSKTPERAEKILFSDRSIGTNATMFTVKAGNEKVISGDYSTYEGLKVGMLEGNSKNENFEELARQKKFHYEPVYYETEAELTSALQSDQLDGIVTGSLRATSNEWLIEELAPSDFYITVRKDRPDLMEEINRAIDQLDLDEPDWRSTLRLKHYSVDDGGHIMLTADERTYLQELRSSGKPLRVLMNPDRRPYSYFEDGKAKGIIPDIFEETARELGIEYEILETGSREEYYQLRSSGEVDVVLDFANDYYLAENEGYKLTESCLDTGFTRLLRKNYSGVVRKVATVDYSDVLENYVSGLYDENEIIYCSSIQECVDAVISGQADAAILYTYTAETVLQEDVTNRLSFMVMGNASLSYAIGVNVHDGYILRSILNKAVTSTGSAQARTDIEMRDTEMMELNPRQKVISFLYDYPVYGLLILLLLFLVIIAGFRVRNQKQLKLKIADVSGKYEKQKLELKDALADAEAASQSKSLFLFNMSHDIRTPMNAIIGFADIAEKHITEPEVVRNAVHKIQVSSDILLKLINDVLDLARIESGKSALDLSPQNLLDGEQGIRLLFREDMEKAGIEFHVESRVQDPYVMCDYLRLNQISINLLSNARKFTPRGGKILYVLRQISGVEDGSATYQISVKDNGIGMSKEFQTKVFDRFERERTSTVSGTQGTGLGLSIVKRIVEMMDGSIEVKSELGKGSEFIVTFRLKVVDREAVIKVDEAGAEMDFTGKRILLVEDNELNREIAVEILQDEGFEVEEAEDGTIAVDKVSHSEPGYYDLVLMDIQMPIMDGYTATEEIRRLDNPKLASVPIVAMTANAFEEDKQKAFACGMDGHLAKPIDVGMLLDTLSEILK